MDRSVYEQAVNKYIESLDFDALHNERVKVYFETTFDHFEHCDDNEDDHDYS